MFVRCNSFRVFFTSVFSSLCIISCPGISTLSFAGEKEEAILNPIVVTATKTAQTADETLASVTVITRKDIERSQSQDVYGLLRSVAGIDVTRSGGTGNTTSIFMRGTNSDHVLVLIDGVRAASATTGTFAFHSLDVSQIERIEIVRGPRASLYGSDAIGGVIQIFTRKSTGASVRIEGGSFGTKKLDVGFGGGDKIKYNLNVSIKDIDGFSSTNYSAPFFDPDKDSFKANSFVFGLELPVSDKLTFNLNTWYNDSETEFDNAPSPTAVIDDRNKTINLSANYNNSDIWTQKLTLDHAIDESQTTSSFSSNITTERKSIDWQHNLVLDSSHLVSAGISYYEDNAENFDIIGDTLVFDKKINNGAIYGNWQTAFGNNDIQLGLRFDDHNAFGSETTGQIAWGLKIDKVKVRASYGSAFKAPNINELFHPGFGGFFAGNPSLQPETSDSFEIGANHSFSKSQKLDVSIYSTNVDNLIAFQGTNFQAVNINKAIIRGIELAYIYNKNLWLFKSNLTIQKAEDDTTKTPLLRRADEKLSLNLSRQLKKTGNINAEILLSSDRTDIGNTVLPGYGVVNLSANYPINSKLTLQGRIDNLTDKQYELASGFNTADRSVFIALRYLM